MNTKKCPQGHVSREEALICEYPGCVFVFPYDHELWHRAVVAKIRRTYPSGTVPPQDL
jgi:hypothetical protein